MHALAELDAGFDVATVSIVVAARNAAATIDETLASVAAQTYVNWEAIVVDDASTDETAEVVERWTRRDRRFRLMDGAGSGAGAARNIGIAAASGDWLLFLDADDWLVPAALETLVTAAEARPGQAGVYGGWIRVGPDGERFDEHPADGDGNLFTEFARTCAFAIHACLVRRSVVEEAGGFDPELATCEDWDLWQRISREGGEFGAVGKTVALYRVRPGSASRSYERFVQDALGTIRRGYAPDPRVARPLEPFALGAPGELPKEHQIGTVLWAASVSIGEGGDARPLVAHMADLLDPTLSPELVANILYLSVPLGPARSVAAWPELYSLVEPRLDDFLVELERVSRAPRFARRTRRTLDQAILSGADRPIASRHVAYAALELSERFDDLHAATDTIVCAASIQGERLGALTLPVCDGVVPAAVAVDAVAARFGWQVLRRFLETTVYRKLEVREEGVYRGDVLLDAGAAAVDHDRIGWTVLLQELWNRPGMSGAQLYDPSGAEEAPVMPCPGGEFVLEVTGEVPALDVEADELLVSLRLGGALVGAFTLAGGRTIGAQELRVAATAAAGIELLLVAVREGLLARPIDGTPLRLRLAEAAKRSASADPVAAALAPFGAGVVLARREPAGFRTTASRRATLPVAVEADAIAAAIARGGRFTKLGERSESSVVYWPDLAAARPSPQPRPDPWAQSVHGESYDRVFFETAFAAGPGPRSLERDAWTHTEALSLLPRTRFRRVLELGCGEGLLTRALAERTRSLVAADISQVALDRAAQRCGRRARISFLQLDLRRDSLPGGFDLVVCDDVLAYAPADGGLAATSERVVAALDPGGHLLSIHSDPIASDREPRHGAAAISETLASVGSLELLYELRGPSRRIELFRKTGRRQRLGRRLRVVEAPSGRAISSPAAAQSTELVTEELPILMYHRVASDVNGRAARWVLPREAFEQQLAYLRDAGYRGVTLEDWREAVNLQRPLPGRAVVITFDDGYRDFLTEAWPLLRRYGYGATVFLVAGQIGAANDWDRGFAPTIPLMTWREIRALQHEGVTFGSHSVTHPHLRGLCNEEIAREALRSQTILAEGLGQPTDQFAYPYGDVDEAVEHLIGASGYTFGLTCRHGRSTLTDALIDLPRIDASCTSLAEFVRRLELS